MLRQPEWSVCSPSLSQSQITGPQCPAFRKSSTPSPGPSPMALETAPGPHMTFTCFLRSTTGFHWKVRQVCLRVAHIRTETHPHARTRTRITLHRDAQGPDCRVQCVHFSAPGFRGHPWPHCPVRHPHRSCCSSHITHVTCGRTSGMSHAIDRGQWSAGCCWTGHRSVLAFLNVSGQKCGGHTLRLQHHVP